MAAAVGTAQEQADSAVLCCAVLVQVKRGLRRIAALLVDSPSLRQAAQLQLMMLTWKHVRQRFGRPGGRGDVCMCACELRSVCPGRIPTPVLC